MIYLYYSSILICFKVYLHDKNSIHDHNTIIIKLFSTHFNIIHLSIENLQSATFVVIHL